MSPAEAQILMALIDIAIKEGLPAFLRFVKNMNIDEPTIEDIQKLHEGFNPLTPADFERGGLDKSVGQ